MKVYENDVNENDWGYRGYLYARLGRRDEAEALAADNPEAPSADRGVRQLAIGSGRSSFRAGREAQFSAGRRRSTSAGDGDHPPRSTRAEILRELGLPD